MKYTTHFIRVAGSVRIGRPWVLEQISFIHYLSVVTIFYSILSLSPSPCKATPAPRPPAAPAMRAQVRG